jgi:hypothetical protein
MPKNNRKARRAVNVPRRASLTMTISQVDSLLDAMRDGDEYGSIVGLFPRDGLELMDEVRRGLGEIESQRGRPCLAYVGNVVRADAGGSGVDATDDVPFNELVASIPTTERSVDVFLATRGGSAQQVARFVNCLRARFDEVHFILPTFCMSAGTLFALSGDSICMTERACLGPIDPQVPTKDGRFVPAQALLVLVNALQTQGQAALGKGQPVPWTAVRLIDSLDKKELGDAITATNYSTMLATQFLELYKFRAWVTRQTSNQPVTPAYRKARAGEIAEALAAHDRWKNHGHAISREVLWNEIQLRIDHPNSDTDRAIRRLWALMFWIFDKTPVLKMMRSQRYSFVRSETKTVTP